ncbi:hypothetical protein APHCRT_1287 [Anaplasma phagocytophilum str. CRT53-1]|uniref:Uncharacterized protein n=1 Tax=Anaplasma phagocytophilum str. CRT53-1 TaxID=1359157 RepID=A0A0F3PTY5_ANAPH|nr:hypothetical protein [Anaplasma phagocytophilum]KJV83728.1 hypothetical protein APHCRT_1287 [Anaplasma phagocytophilum str. CRT53-1]
MLRQRYAEETDNASGASASEGCGGVHGRSIQHRNEQRKRDEGIDIQNLLQRLNTANCISARIAREDVVHTYASESYVSVGKGRVSGLLLIFAYNYERMPDIVQQIA